jgi:hypothetical protein
MTIIHNRRLIIIALLLTAIIAIVFVIFAIMIAPSCGCEPIPPIDYGSTSIKSTNNYVATLIAQTQAAATATSEALS